ncbi:5-hydroxytryptamine receptor 1-like [Paramuricea clavata]|uniref:5-hydroxytryptamine receptor 1-like n=1 Tax=Paramuricea clavata TaxID=317549 RepID=A0A7D9JY95_PARCT|nr:5-hydroxytryptamine receptor 1-like [Paramuricea clavata]
MLSNNTRAMYNHTNQTETGSDSMKLEAFRDQLDLAEKIILIIFAVCTILGNTLVLIATWRERRLHQPNKYFIACLAAADLLVGMIVEPLKVYYSSLNDESAKAMSIHLCRFIVWTDTFALTASIYTLTFISFDRFFKIRKPLQYKSRMTTSKSVKIIFTICLISTAFATYAATPDSGSNYGLVCSPANFGEIKGYRYYTFLAVSAFFLPTVVMLVMYALVFVIVYKRQKMLRNGELGQTCNDQNQRSAFLQDLKTIRMLLVVVGVFILCWGPEFIFLLFLYNYPVLNDHEDRSLSYWYLFFAGATLAFTLPFFNSLCNPIIYACLDQTYGAAFKNLFRQMMCRPSPRRRQVPVAIELPPLRTRQTNIH